jgi:hypothetical protein
VEKGYAILPQFEEACGVEGVTAGENQPNLGVLVQHHSRKLLA